MADAELHPNNLRSKKEFYDKFDAADGSGCTNAGANPQDLETKLQTDFSGCQKIITDAEKIAKAYCYASTQNEKSIYENKEPCRLFYYWLGDQYGKDLKNNHTFSKLPIAIHETLKGDEYLRKCRIKYNDVDETLLPQMKTVFDYYYDYKDVKDNILNIKDGREGEWSRYLNKVSAACKAVRDYCTQGQNKSGDYCTEFNNKYDVHCNTATLSKEKCELQTQHTKEKEAASLAADQAVTKATTTSSISSIFGTLATLGAPFLLYKYKPWSSWFGNHSSGKRKRRSAGRDIDDLTETSTIGPTTEDDSTVYGVQSRRGRTGTRTNDSTNSHRNVGRQNIGYQNM